MKKHIGNPYNLLFSLLAYLPIFLFPVKYDIGRTLTLIGLVFLLICQFFFNRGHQASGAEDPHGKAMEKMTIKALEKYTPITTHGAYGGVGVTGPTQNIQATDSQRAQLTSWVLIFGLWFICLVGLGDALHGVAAESSFTGYMPLFIGLLLTAAADLLLTSPKGKSAKLRLLALAVCGLLLVWYMPVVL